MKNQTLLLIILMVFNASLTFAQVEDDLYFVPTIQKEKSTAKTKAKKPTIAESDQELAPAKLVSPLPSEALVLLNSEFYYPTFTYQLVSYYETTFDAYESISLFNYDKQSPSLETSSGLYTRKSYTPTRRGSHWSDIILNELYYNSGNQKTVPFSYSCLRRTTSYFSLNERGRSSALPNVSVIPIAPFAKRTSTILRYGGKSDYKPGDRVATGSYAVSYSGKGSSGDGSSNSSGRSFGNHSSSKKSSSSSSGRLRNSRSRIR